MRLRRRILLVLGLLTVAACTPNVPYRFKGYEDEPDLERYRNRSDVRSPRQTCWVGVTAAGELQHQPPPCDVPLPPEQAAGEPGLAGWRYHLSVIEFDDLGDFWLRTQLEREFQCLLFAVTSVEEPWLTDWRSELCADDKTPPAPDGKEKRSAIVTLFIHGWKHNASPKNESSGNLGSFHRVLRRMAQGELARAGRCIAAGGIGCENRPREIIGVYIGWRGKSFARIPLLQEFTIFNRRAAAERVARVAVSHTIHRVVNWTKESNRESRAILVGHSLGGVILENVLTRTATVERDWSDAEARSGNAVARQPMPVDLAFLINPANEAILAEQTIDVLGPPTPPVVAESRKTGRQVEVPIIVSIASPGDKAVSLYFPLSQRLKAFFGLRKFKPGQRFLFTHTPGFSDDPVLLSHRFERASKTGSQDLTSLHSITPPPRVTVSAGRCQQPVTVEGAGRRKEIHREKLEQLDRSMEVVEGRTEGVEIHCIESISYDEAARVESRAYTEKKQEAVVDARKEESRAWVIERRPDTLNLSPYWVMRVDTDIIGSHTDIFNDRVIALMSAMVSLKQGIFDESVSSAGTDGP